LQGSVFGAWINVHVLVARTSPLFIFILL